jgi:hypothetical protein
LNVHPRQFINNTVKWRMKGRIAALEEAASCCNRYTCNNTRTSGSGVFYVIHAKAVWGPTGQVSWESAIGG